MNKLLDAFKQTTFQVNGHGPRKIQVLKEAFENLDGQLESEMYGKGKLIEDFQEKMAFVLGKEAAVFFPSGTMAQQIAMRIWCDEKGLKKVAYHPLCHLEVHEEDGLRELHQIESVLLADKTRVIEFEDVAGMKEDAACVLLELPQREIGGQLPDYQTLEAISAYCKEKGIMLHLDGARLFEILPYYEKTAAEICSLFDSVYISFYKGIGGIAGAVLAGDSDFIEKSKIWKRRHGGDLISLYPYYLSADYYFEKRIGKMKQYYEHAKELAGFYNQCYGVTTKPEVPVSNMFHVHFDAPKEEMEQVLTEICVESGIGLSGHIREVTETNSYFEVSVGDLYEILPREKLMDAFKLLDEKMRTKFL
ncbi:MULTISPECIES: threonine aldolase family protein [Neobacillus]|uniref:Low specificity L-threonine aldolase n=1 Tax=Neobacillus rhizophilus TaxID=2833579 RepID=A0A942YW07_9BACI|nr:MULTISPECIES: beta-eliminating lyase-related protein [Neobacillus]MBS4214482.1 low specificity L-threonine aldolase [Neobacillus rhizophilus]